MKICAIICEYNPLHNGHIEHIRKTMEQSGCDTLLLLMSGNFVQRGEPAIANKFDRASLAIKAGADIVIELPTVYALSNAEQFARGAIKILSNISEVECLSFGSEHGDIQTLIELAKFLQAEPNEFKEIYKKHLQKGQSPATCKTSAVLDCIYSGLLKIENKTYATEALCSPNSILAIEYIRALIAAESKIQPLTVKRQGNGYNDIDTSCEFCSATAIRNCFYGDTLEDIKHAVPDYVYSFLQNQKNTNSLSYDRLSSMIMYKLRSSKAEDIGLLYDINEGLENRIKKYSDFTNSYSDLVNAIKTKRYTHARIRRIMLYSLLGITKKLVAKAEKCPPYARVLAIKKGRQDILSCLAKNKIFTLTRKEDYAEAFQLPINALLEIDMLAADIYALLNSHPAYYIAGQDIIKGVILA